MAKHFCPHNVCVLMSAPTQLQKMIEHCFTREELNLLEPMPEFRAAVEGAATPDDLYWVCRVGESLLNPAPR